MSGTYSPYQGPPQGPGGYPAPPNPGARYIESTYIECLSYMTESWVILGTTCQNWYFCRFPTYTPGQQRGPSPPQNLGQRPPNAGEDLVEKPVYDMNPLNFPGGGPQQYQMHPMHQQQPQQQQTCYTFHVPQVCYLCTLTSNIRTITKPMDIS